MVISSHGVLRGALAATLSAEPDLSVVAMAVPADAVLAVAVATRPDIIVIGIDTNDTPELTTARRLVETLPDCGVLVLTDRMTPVVVRRAMRQRVRGIIGRDSSPARLVDYVRRLARGEWAIDPLASMEALRTADNPLTERERQVLGMAAEGLPARQIAAQLFITQGTVRNHVSTVIRKLGVRDRQAAIRQAQEAGWLP